MRVAPKATIDFETRSACNLKKHGPWRYSIHPTTDVLCLIYRLPHWPYGQTALWHPAFPSLGLDEHIEPESLVEFLQWIEDGGLIEAHNVWFEFCIWQNIMVERYGWAPIPVNQWRCSAAKAATQALPRSLDDATTALKLPIRKDVEGSKVMMKMTKPRKSRKKEREQWAKDGVQAPRHLWHESVELLERLIQYCRQDVLAEEALSHTLPDIEGQELDLFQLDLRMNARGFQIDKAAVRVALRLIHRESILLNQELTLLTNRQVRKATQRARMLQWFAENGLDLADTQKATLDALVAPTAPPLTPVVHRAVEIVRALGRSSTAKYQSMKAWMARDGRVRGGVLYHGATTGRWAGKGVQPHNFPKGTPKDTPEGPRKINQDALWTTIKEGSRADIQTGYRSVMEALSNALRGAITAGPKRKLFVADYAAIEARVVLWLAGENEALQVFRDGRDIYLEMASDIYGYACNKQDHPTERGMGKIACLGADTRVLTNNGIKRITDVLLDDQLWDGKEWVFHGGKVYNGMREAICLDGLTCTPDHLIQTQTSWQPAIKVGRNVETFSQAWASGQDSLKSLVMLKDHEGVFPSSLSDVLADLRCYKLLKLILNWVVQPGVIFVQGLKRRLQGRKNIGTMLISFPILNRELDCLIESVPSLQDVKIHLTKTMPIMEDAASVFGMNGWKDMEENVGEAKPLVDGNSFSTLSHFRGGITQYWIWIVLKTIKGIYQEIFDLCLDLLTRETSGKLKICSNVSKILKPVYDIVNAGPRHRFTVLTNSGAFVVHNCLGLGFQMGASKFQISCANLGVDIDEDFAKQVVTAYREKFPRVVQMWEDQNQDAIKAVVTGKHIHCGRMTWFVTKPFLYCRLPSGRCLAYPFPEVSDRQMPWGGTRPSLSFMGVDGYTHKWKRQVTYGGMIVENQTQAVARDVMAEAMLRADQHPSYDVVLSVHDEVVAEASDEVGNIQEFEALMVESPDWADGLPIAAEGWEAFRYHK